MFFIVSFLSLLQISLFAVEDAELPLNSTMNSSVVTCQSLNRSGVVRKTTPVAESASQTEPVVIDYPQIRKYERICTDEIKLACAKVSSVCGISVKSAILAVQTVCESVYGHKLYLNSESQANEDPEATKSEKTLPSERTITDYKQMMASNEEMNAGLALYNKPTGIKVTMHYDTTSRNNIDGEWPAIIIAFSDGKEYRLRPLFFAYEDRKQIAALLFKT